MARATTEHAKVVVETSLTLLRSKFAVFPKFLQKVGRFFLVAGVGLALAIRAGIRSIAFIPIV